ncbi:GNAT family N-acetyltransferase [Agromyces albus]|uniref:GNAT family N-acetyltransferase n=1 Tax=Agromyces albus TaxID=205332 RepID=UPI002788AB28|nr:GNAT family N-acetyltransferase [Agromyces albus]MDQ0577147.1 GNAT superfamily N-acetyltransferase [Agromyces albus]
MQALLIRPVRVTDAAALVPLMGELGYPSTTEEIEYRLARNAHQHESEAWVAVHDGAVVGFAAGLILWSYVSNGASAQLTSLVVSSETRGTGVGRQLVAHFEVWARGRGAKRVVVTSALYRDDAHAFYPAIGYPETGKRFGKPLD